MFSWLPCVARDTEMPAVRTSKTPACPPENALSALKEGNARYVNAETKIVDRQAFAGYRKDFVANGQKPLAAIVSCADSRAPVDTIFDSIPGDLFVLRNAGNTLARAEGSFVGSLEYAVAALDTKLILVLGHTKCGAVAGATKTFLSQKDSMANFVCPPVKKGQTGLDIMLGGIVPSAKEAADELPGATEEQIAVKAVELNVFRSMKRLLEYSDIVRQKVKSGEVQVQGGIYDLETGKVEFLGIHPSQDTLLASHLEVAESHSNAHDKMAAAPELSGKAVGA